MFCLLYDHCRQYSFSFRHYDIDGASKLKVRPRWENLRLFDLKNEAQEAVACSIYE